MPAVEPQQVNDETPAEEDEDRYSDLPEDIKEWIDDHRQDT